MKITIEFPDSELEKNCIHFIHLYTDNDKKITRVTQVKSGICKYDYYDEDIKFSEVVEQIEDNNFGWINCKDYLPEKSGMYLVTGKWKDKPNEIWICEFLDLGPIRGWCGSPNRPEVFAWQPIPIEFMK